MPEPEEVLREAIGQLGGGFRDDLRQRAFAALDQLLQERDAAIDLNIRWRERAGAYHAQIERLGSELVRLRTDLAEARAALEAIGDDVDAYNPLAVKARAALSHQGEPVDRCPTCGSDDRDSITGDCSFVPDPWHSGEPTEGEQG